MARDRSTPMDTVVRGGLLVTMDPDTPHGAGGLGLIEDATIGIDAGEIVHVGTVDEPPNGRPIEADVTIDADGCLVLPGLINAHTHMSHTLIRGAAQDVPEIEWMNRALGPIANAMTEKDRIVGARLGAIEAIRSGAATICAYTSDAASLVESVYRPLGVRTVATETINEVPDDRDDLGPREVYPFDREKGEAGLGRAEALFDRYADEPLIEPMYGPQALDMVSLELLSAIDRRSRSYGRRIHMHVAQGEREAIQIEERYGTDESTVSVLEREGLLSDRLLAAHLHGATDDERARLAAAGVRMVGCPSSIVAIDGIVPPICAYRDHGGTVAIGTDQAPGPGGHNLLRELRTAAICSKADRADPTALPAWAALSLVTIDAARALGIDDRVGSVEVGKRADLTIVDLESVGVAPTVDAPFHTAIPNLVYGASGSEVRDVIVAGEPILRDGTFRTVDAPAAIDEANERAALVFDRAADAWRDAGSALVSAVEDGWL